MLLVRTDRIDAAGDVLAAGRQRQKSLLLGFSDAHKRSVLPSSEHRNAFDALVQQSDAAAAAVDGGDKDAATAAVKQVARGMQQLNCDADSIITPPFLRKARRKFAIINGVAAPSGGGGGAVSLMSHGTFVRDMSMLHYYLLAHGYDSVMTTLGECMGDVYAAAATPHLAACTDRQFIVFAPHLIDKAPQLYAHLPPGSVLVQTEQIRDAKCEMCGAAYVSLLKDARFALWDFSPANERTLVDGMGIAKQRISYLPYGFVPQLAHQGYAVVDEDVDVAFFGLMNARRFKVLHALEALGYDCVFVEGVYPHERDFIMSRAKVVLNIHYYAAKSLEINRIYAALSMGKLVVSERSSDPATDERWAHGVVFASDGDDMVRLVDEYLKSPAKRNARRRAATDMLLDADYSAQMTRLIEPFNDACVRGAACTTALASEYAKARQRKLRRRRRRRGDGDGKAQRKKKKALLL
jgi:hypothetical protein